MLLVVLFSKLLTFLLRLTNRGGGTTLPGLLVEMYFPNVFSKLIRQIPKKIVITGTNGKTTTQTLLVSMLQEAGYKVASNISGANLSRGIISSLMNQANILGKLDYDYAVFEVEEGTFPKIATELDASIIVVTNLFRDQLDAYGEIDKTKEYILEAINKTKEAKVILNANDPRVLEIGKEIENKTLYFGLNKEDQRHFAYEGEQVAKVAMKRNVLTATNIRVNNDLSSSFDIKTEKIEINNFKSPGVYNVYNALAAIQIALTEKLTIEDIQSAFDKFEPAFGRGEEVKIERKLIKMLLIKNPAGFSITLQMLNKIEVKDLFILINDNIADGKDVSWLWDSKIELINDISPKNIVLSGTRAEDMLLRLKYAMDTRIRKVTYNHFKSGETNIYIEPQIQKAVNKALEVAEIGNYIYTLPTYTAMLELRKELGKRVKLKDFWK